ncbi:hypothetical protein ACJJTC_018713 [Scirpophaga incertulas]
MDQIVKSTIWDNADFSDSTADPSVAVSVMAEEVPTLTVAAIVGVTVVVLLAIAAVFLLGVFIDWRQQKMLEKQMGQTKRLKSQRRENTHIEADSTSIANTMEEPGLSIPPAEVLRNIP